MLKAYYTLDLTEAVLLKDHLVQNGIAAKVRNKGAVRIPHEGIACEVWVADDADGEEVRALIRGFLARRKETRSETPSWQCQSCREENPGEFELCFSCGQAPAAPGAAD